MREYQTVSRIANDSVIASVVKLHRLPTKGTALRVGTACATAESAQQCAIHARFGGRTR